MIPDRRRHSRHLVTPPVYTMIDGSGNGGILYDVGEGGLAVDIVGPSLTAKQVLLEFDMPEIGQRFEGTGQITWNNEPANRVGLRFVDLSETSNQRLKEWLWAKSIPSKPSEEVVVQDLKIEVRPLERVAPPSEIRREPIALHWFEPAERAQPPHHNYAAHPVRDLREPMPAVSQAPTGSGSAQEAGDSLLRNLRSTFSESDVARRPEFESEIMAAQTALERKRRRKWILLAVSVFAEILLLAVGTWVYTTRDWNLAAIFEHVKARVAATLSSSSPVPPSAAVVRSKKSAVGGRTHEDQSQEKQTTSSVDEQPRENNTSPAVSQFEVLDAQNRRWLLPRTSTAVRIQFERPSTSDSKNDSQEQSGLAASSSSEPASHLPPHARSLALGRVSQQSSGELPTVQVMPEYPSLAVRNNVQGRVDIKAVIGKDGSLQNLRVVSPPSPLDSTVLDAVRKWRYQPHYVGGEPVEVETEIIVSFSVIAR
jgi:TonB family protein